VDQLQKGFFNFCPAETWTPTVNVYENEAAYLVCVDLSGVDKDKIDLSVSDNQLRLRGQRAVPSLPTAMAGEPRARRLRVHLMEIDHGPFCREVDLPHDVDRDKIVASYDNGMLWVQVPKK
jgi:HSP20 family protein